MKNLMKKSRRGLGIASAFFTKVIVLSLCMSLALGTTAFANDGADGGVAGATTSSESSSGGSGDNGSGSSSESSSGGSSESSSDSSSESGSDSSSESDSSSSSESGSVSSSESGSDSKAEQSGAPDNSAADSSQVSCSESNGTDASAGNNADAEKTNASNTEEQQPKADETPVSNSEETDKVVTAGPEETKQETPEQDQTAEKPAEPEQEQPAEEEAQPETEQEQDTDETTESEFPPLNVSEEQINEVTTAIAEFENPALLLVGTEESDGTIDSADALQKAIDAAAKKGEEVTITLTKDFAIDKTIVIPEGANIKLVLDGKELTFTGEGDAMFQVKGSLSVYDKETTDSNDSQSSGSQSSASSSSSSNSSNSNNSSNSGNSGRSEHKNSSNVVTAKEEQTGENKAADKPETDNVAAEQKDALQETLKNWVNEDGSVKETKEVVDKVLTDVGVITTEKAVNVIFNVVAGGQLNLFGGIIKNGVGANSSVTGVKVEKDGAFEMSGGVIADMTNSGVIINGGKAEISDGAAIVNNSTKLNGGGISVKNGGTLIMDGGLVAGNEAIFNGKAEDHNGQNSKYGQFGGKSGNGGGVAVDESVFIMTGGKIHGNKADDGIGGYEIGGSTKVDGLGGGVYVVGTDGRFELSGNGVISNNKAGAGGGIFIHTRNKDAKPGDGALFTMTGGEVSGNTALYGEGGGIFINSRFGDASKNNTITAGKITGNKTLTKNDLGGGGIYVNNEGTLNIQNAIVTANIAQGLGGGLAACVHGRTLVFTKNGMIFFDNESLGNAVTLGHNGNGTKIDGNNLWKDNEEFKKLAQDIFTASDMDTDGNMGGILIGNKTLFDGDTSWEGYRFYYENGEIVSDKVEYDEEGKVIYANRLLGLTSNPDDAAVQKALEVMNNALSGYLIISGNESSVHGGGIANNGILTIGVEQKEFDETPDEVSKDFEMDKTLEKDENAPEDTPDRELQDGEFEFILGDVSGNELGSVKNDADGKVNIKLPDFKEPGKYTFLVSEKNSGNAPNSETTVIYDGNVYVVVIEVTEKITEEIVNVGGVEYTIKHSELTAGEPKFYKAELDENGNVKYDGEGNPVYGSEELPGIAFENTYTKPEKPKEPETPNTPDRPDRPKKDPDVDVPEPEVPLAETPEVEIPEEAVPLSDVSEEIEIGDPEVPLGDVPRTGDAPVFPLAMAIFGICGVLLAKLRKSN